MNYLIGNDPARWHARVPTFSRVKFEQVYPGVDVICYGNPRQLEYDIVVAPGADPSQIALEIAGAEDVKLTADDDLLVHTVAGEIRQHRPWVFQKALTGRTQIGGRYVVRAGPEKIHKVGFELGVYDRKRALIIDPVLTYSTFLGGVNNELANALAVDAAGNVYVAGNTFSVSDFPTTPGAYQTNAASDLADVFVTKLNPAGSGLVYSTYLGGGETDFGLGIAVDAAGSAYIVGETYAVTSFPVTYGAVQTTYGGGSADAFVTKLSADGSKLIYSTFLGGGGYEGGSDGFSLFEQMGIAVDTNGNAHVTGATTSTRFPTTPGALQANNAGASDIFVAKLNSTGTALIYSTLIGGSQVELSSRVALDRNGNAYVVGTTASANFPTTPGSYKTNITGLQNAFLAKFNPSGALMFSTLLGGNGGEYGQGVAVDSSGNAYVTGLTGSSNFPVSSNAYQRTYRGGLSDGFVTKFNASGSGLMYSTYLGGTQSEQPNGIAVDANGNAYVVGDTESINFPTKNALQGDPSDGNTDAFVAKLTPDGSDVVYSTYLGGNQYDQALDVTVDPVGNAYVVGWTFPTANPPFFPTTPSAYRPTIVGNADGFVVKLSDSAVDPLISRFVSFNRIADGFFQMQLTAATNRPLTIETSSNLLNWIALTTNTTTTGTITFTDSNAPAFPRRFYRGLTR